MDGCVYKKDDGGCYLHCYDKPSCADCKTPLLLTDPGFLSKWVDPLLVTDRERRPVTCLRNLLSGASVFLACGGPSANLLPLERLGERGVWTMAVNNMAGHPRFRPQAFVCADPPLKFSHSIWLDPAVMKFIPKPKLVGRRGALRRKVEGKFVDLPLRTSDCPNVWGFERHSWLWPDDRFFLTDGACWGNHEAGVQKTGQPKTVCTMLLAMRLLRYLGAKRVFLIGVDFRMAASYGYAFAQDRTQDAAASNNHQYSIVNDWLCQMENNGTFKRFGIEFYNCYEHSALRAFPYVPFEEALEDARGFCEAVPDLSGWYDK